MPATGAVVWRANNTIPAGYLLCDGQAVSRTTYADLFTALGTTYGAGDGSTTFNVPNLVDRYPIGASGAVTRGSTAGAKDHTHAGPSHTHSVTQPAAHSDHTSTGNHTHDAHGSALGVGIGGANAVSLTAPTTHASQGAHAHDAHSAHSGSATQAATGTTGSNEPPFIALVPAVKT